MRISGFARATLAAVGATLLLAGCVAPAPAPTPAASASPSDAPSSIPTPTPTPGADSVIIGPDRISVTRDGSVTAEFDYFVPLESVIAELTAVFGEDPVFEHMPGTPNSDRFPIDKYSFGGFSVMEYNPDGEIYPGVPLYRIRTTTNDVEGIRIETIDGIRIGDDARAVAASRPGESTEVEFPSGPGLSFALEQTEIPGASGPQQFVVSISAELFVVSSIFSPLSSSDL